MGRKAEEIQARGIARKMTGRVTWDTLGQVGAPARAGPKAGKSEQLPQPRPQPPREGNGGWSAKDFRQDGPVGVTPQIDGTRSTRYDDVSGIAA